MRDKMETSFYVKYFAPGETWYQPGLGGEQSARQYFWNNNQARLLTELQSCLNQGWRPITEVGPSAFVLGSYEVTEHTFGFMNVVLWFLTLGISFIFDLLSGFGAYKMTRYYPTEFRVNLMR
jgi:hypothetical protein